MKCVHFSLAKIVLAGSEHITFWGNCHPRPSKTNHKRKLSGVDGIFFVDEMQVDIILVTLLNTEHETARRAIIAT